MSPNCVPVVCTLTITTLRNVLEVPNVQITSLSALKQTLELSDHLNSFLRVRDVYQLVTDDKHLLSIVNACQETHIPILMKVGEFASPPMIGKESVHHTLDPVKVSLPFPEQRFIEKAMCVIDREQMPELYHDQTMQALLKFFSSTDDSPHPMHVLVAPPGSGKTYSVRHACQLTPHAKLLY
jgi:hypothetical protein